MGTIFRKISSSRKSAARREARRRLALFRKNYFADVPVDLEALPLYRNEIFPRSGPLPWIDRPDALAILEEKVSTQSIEPFDAEICRGLIVDGYYVARNLIDPDVLDAAWQCYERALEDDIVSVEPERHGDGDGIPGRSLDPHLKIPQIREILWQPEILRITDMLFGRKTVPFQTIIEHKSIEQLPHSDAIHMTTYPLGFLLAAWIAFEDVHLDSGPLTYYPKSHRLLPDLLSADVGIEMLKFKADLAVYNERYERHVQQRLEDLDLHPVPFCGQKGDVFFWHANLVHGSSRRTNLAHSRKALVCHYFAKGAFTYHDLSGNASRLHRNGPYAELADDGLSDGKGENLLAKSRAFFDMMLKPIWLSVRPRGSPREGGYFAAEMKETKMTKPAKKIQGVAGHPSPDFGHIETLPAIVYEGPAPMLYRIWSQGDANSVLRVEADGVVRNVVPPDSVDVVGAKISISSKSGHASCEYQFLGFGLK